MLAEMYFKNMKEVLGKIEDTQMGMVRECAEAIADSLCGNGIWHLLDTGHMLMYEGVGRTGGMMAVRPIRTTVDISNPTRKRSITGKKNVYLDEIEGFPAFVLAKANVAAGDILLIGSVSGINVLPVEMALRAREMGVRTIALTSVEYSSALKSNHPSGKRLFEACDFVLDNCGNAGDTLVEVSGTGKRICPSSGIAAAYLMWALQSQVVETLVARGKDPSIYISNHLENASRINNEAWERYETLGY